VSGVAGEPLGAVAAERSNGRSRIEASKRGGWESEVEAREGERSQRGAMQGTRAEVTPPVERPPQQAYRTLLETRWARDPP
jgi:hypothetical protein